MSMYEQLAVADRSGSQPLCLVTGATGYIGGRLINQLLIAGYRVRVMARFPDRLRDLPWYNDVEIVQADALDPATVRVALADVDIAYYLLHAINQGENFKVIEEAMANIFADTAKELKVKKIIYLGGIIPKQKLSEHLAAREITGEILRNSGVPTIEFRAGVVLGSGSASFEMLRYLTERLPIMVTPKWVTTRIQPISVRDVLRYLVGAAAIKEDLNRSFDIGGPDIFTYKEMMHRYAKVAKLRKRIIITVPLLTPRLSSLWVGFVTPVPGAIARPLVRSLVNEVVCSESDIKKYLPDPPEGLTDFDTSIDLALTRVREAQVSTRWSSASVGGAPAEPLPTDPSWAGGTLYRDVQKREVNASKEQLWKIVEGIGGDHGYFSMDWAWEIRGILDRIVGGVGLRRGRRDPDHLHVGETLDFWRVEAREPNELLRLRAEMKSPGLAWLEFKITPITETKSEIVQQAIFYPRGLAGHAYWWIVSPFHVFVFKGMINNICKKAQQTSSV